MQMFNVYTKYQDVLVKAVERVEFPLYVLSMDHYELQKAIIPNRIGP